MCSVFFDAESRLCIETVGSRNVVSTFHALTRLGDLNSSEKSDATVLNPKSAQDQSHGRHNVWIVCRMFAFDRLIVASGAEEHHTAETMGVILTTPTRSGGIPQ